MSETTDWASIRSCAACLGFSWDNPTYDLMGSAGMWILQRQVGTTEDFQRVGEFDTEQDVLVWLDKHLGFDITKDIE